MNDTPSDYCTCSETAPLLTTQDFNDPTTPCLQCGLPSPPASPAEAPRQVLLPDPRPVRVLCIDDDPLFLEQISDILEEAGHRALTARDPDTGLSLATREHPDLILLDLVMPGMDGIEVCRRLKQDPESARIPVVVLTRLNHPELNLKAIDAGAILALQKTSSPDAVLRLIETAMNLSRSQSTGETPPPGTRRAAPEPTA
jgi:CheY-like chemotaxis protein